MAQVPDETSPKKVRRIRWQFSAAAVLLAVLLAGIVATLQLAELAREEIRREGEAVISTLGVYLNSEIDKMEKAASTLSDSPWIPPALIGGTTPDIERATAVLKRYQKVFGISVAYLMNREGLVVASSNRDAPDSFVGENYSFRPYFMEAVQGKVGLYFALGVTSARKGFFASAPVADAAGRIIGCVALKSELQSIETHLRHYPLSFFVSPEGIVFLSGRKDFVLKSLWPVEKKEADRLLASRQFGTRPFEAVLRQEVNNGDEIDFEGERYAVWRSHAQIGKWSIVLFSHAHRINLYRLVGITGTLFLELLLLSVVAVLYFTDRTARLLEESERRFRELSITDGLTGLFNLRHFYACLDAEVARSRRYGHPLSILLMDIDDFKQYNDRYGHMEGDHVLENLADTIRRCIRRTDVAFRYGGEEFIVLTPETGKRQAAVTAERIRNDFRQRPLQPNGRTPVFKTVSIGIAEYKEGEDPRDFVARADEYMFRAKRAGKNRISAPEPAEAEERKR
ncbi:MAG: Response regulator PleD [Syntrophaceae bacterium PtaU1.Bin231]|nr:MAG: Response regulator PleD [Syntrophaceae bacterium PtaU1.Bin231]